ncbi:MAG: hypothetical protein ACI9SE_004515 [Neolewinella sp.]
MSGLYGALSVRCLDKKQHVRPRAVTGFRRRN